MSNETVLGENFPSQRWKLLFQMSIPQEHKLAHMVAGPVVPDTYTNE